MVIVLAFFFPETPRHLAQSGRLEDAKAILFRCRIRPTDESVTRELEEIKKAIHELYKVDVTSVNVVNRAPKQKRYMNKRGFQEGYRKAIVTIKDGQKIDLV